MKKKNAIMIADTRPFLIGHVLLQIQKTNPGLFDEALIYYQKMSDKDKKILNSIMPCRFIKYDHPFSDDVLDLPFFKKFSVMMFPRYDMFKYLDEFKTVTWIDTDVLIVGDLSEALEKACATGMAANFEDEDNCSFFVTDYVKTSFKVPMADYDMTKYNMSSGFIVVADTLPLRDEYTKWCYEKTVEYADNLVLPDQGILNIMIQEFQIDVASVGRNGAYCFYPEYQRDPKNAIVIHSWGSRKFWNNWYLFNRYPEWKKYYDEWVNLGGSKYNGDFKPAVSVIIPCYKPDTVKMRKALDSILLNQIDKSGNRFDNCEVIVVLEPVETEETEKLIESYNDPRLKLIINEDRYGIAKSINVGIKNAQSDYIMRMDDDDISAPTRLYKQIEYLNNNKDISLVTSDFEYFEDMNERRYTFDGEMSKAWSIFTCPFDHPTIMFRKKFFVNNNLLYDEKRGYVEDWELWLRAFDKGMIVGCIHEVLFYHRWHNGSAGQNNKTVDMMRELVQKNFKKLGVSIDTDDLPIVGPWNGMLDQENYNKLSTIFDKALTANLSKKLYDQKCLEKAFRLRLTEAKTGKLSGIVFPVKRHIDVVDDTTNNYSEPIQSIPRKRSLIKRIIIKLFRRFYIIFKNRMVSIIRESLYDTDKKIINTYLKMEEISNSTNDRLSNVENKLQELLDYNDAVKGQHTSDLMVEKISAVEAKTVTGLDKIYDLRQDFDFLNYYIWENVKLEKKIFLISSPEHSNIGDSAILLGELQFIKKYYPQYRLIEISGYEFEGKFAFINNIINDDDLILLQGGGNLGNRYLHEEIIRRKVISSFAENKIVILPQTIYFEPNDDGRKELAISQEIYNKHKDLTIFTRGKESFELASKYFANAKKYESFDLALALNKNYNFDRSGIMACIRDYGDESGLQKGDYKKIFDIIKNNDPQYIKTNNIHGDNIYKKDRGIVVNQELEKFAKHKVVVTDRLHGMIFSIITKTPCVVISSYNYKIKEFYNMFSQSNAIFFIDNDIEKLDDAIKKALEVLNPTYPDIETNIEKIYKHIDWK